MKTSVQQLSDFEVQVDVEIPSEDVDKAFNRQLARYNKQSRVRGFRPGKAPKGVILKSYGPQIQQSAIETLINQSVSEVLDKVEDYMLIGEPKFEPQPLKQGEPFKYALICEIKPKVAVHSWQNIEVAVPIEEVDEDKLNAHIGVVQRKYSEQVPVEDRKSDQGDFITINTTGEVDGVEEPRLTMEDFDVIIGDNRMIPGFEDELVGLAPDDEKSFDITFPDDYDPDFAGKEARFHVKVVSLTTMEMPELDDELAEDAGYESFDHMRETILKELEDEAAGHRREKAEEAVMQALFESHQFGIPSTMVENAMRYRINHFMGLFMSQGLPREQAIGLLENNIESIQSQAVYQVRRELILEGIARELELDFTDEELSALIVEKIEQGGESVAKDYEDIELREAERRLQIRRKALDALMESTRIIDAAPESDDAAEEAPDAEEATEEKAEAAEEGEA